MKCIYRPVGLTSSCSPGSQIAPACTCSPRPPPPPRRAPVSPQCRDRVSRHTPRSDLTQTSNRVENFIYFLGLLQFESYLEEGNQFSSSPIIHPHIFETCQNYKDQFERIGDQQDRDIIIWDLLGGILSVMNCAREVCLRELASVPADRVPDWAVGSTGLLLTGPSISYPRRDTQTPSHWAGYALNLSAWRWKIN